MKKVFFLLTLYFLSPFGHLQSQVRFEIEIMSVQNIKANLDDNVYIEGKEAGPLIVLECTLFNEGEEDLELVLSNSRSTLFFNYQGKNFTENLIHLNLDEGDSVVIKSKGSYNFYYESNFLFTTSLWQGPKADYTEILLEILPTVRVRYKDSLQSVITTHTVRVNIEK